MSNPIYIYRYIYIYNAYIGKDIYIYTHTNIHMYIYIYTTFKNQLLHCSSAWSVRSCCRSTRRRPRNMPSRSRRPAAQGLWRVKVSGEKHGETHEKGWNYVEKPWKIDGKLMNHWNKIWKYMAGWWFGTFFIFAYIGNNHPNRLIFFRGVQTTNQKT